MSEARFQLRCEKWLEKAYSKATKEEEFRAIARLYQLLIKE